MDGQQQKHFKNTLRTLLATPCQPRLGPEGEAGVPTSSSTGCVQGLLLWAVGAVVLDPGLGREEVTLESRLPGGMLIVPPRLTWGLVILGHGQLGETVILDSLLSVATVLFVSRLREEVNILVSRMGGREQVPLSMQGGGLGTLAAM